MLLQFCKAAQGTEIRTSGPDAGHAGRISQAAADVQRDLFLDDAFFVAGKGRSFTLPVGHIGQ